MQVEPLRSDLVKYLKKHGLARKFDKQLKLFLTNPHYPSLHTEILEPKSLKIYSFRLDKKYRAIFIVKSEKLIEIVDINCHYR